MSLSSNIHKVNTNFNLKINNLNCKNNLNIQYNDPIKNFIYDTVDYIINETEKTYSLKDIYYPEIDKDKYTPQGITTIDDKTFISAHGEDNARLYVYNTYTGEYIGLINLDQNSHVGGTTFDKENNVLYVTNGSGHYSTYDYNMLKEYMEDENQYIDGKLQLNLKSINNIEEEEFKALLINSKDPKVKELINKYDIHTLYITWESGKEIKELEPITNCIISTHSTAIYNDINANCTASTTCFHNGLLYTCHFVGTKNGEMDILRPIYTTNSYGNKIITYERINDKLISIPPRTQGVAVTEYEGKQYILFSQSIGPWNGSSITVYEVTDDGEYINKGVQYFRENGMEGIEVDENGNITACFEFENKTLKTDMRTLLSDLSDEDDYYNIWGHFKQKIGGAYWDINGDSTKTKVVSSFKSAIKNPSPANLVKAFVTIEGSKSEIVKLAMYTFVPESWRESKAVNSTMDTISYGLDTLYKDTFYNYADEINKHGLIKGTLSASAINLTTTSAKISNLGFKGLMSLGQSGASLINLGADAIGLDFELDLDSFDIAKEYVDEKVKKFENTVVKTADWGMDKLDKGLEKVGDGLEYAWDHTGGALCKKAKSIVPFF